MENVLLRVAMLSKLALFHLYLTPNFPFNLKTHTCIFTNNCAK